MSTAAQALPSVDPVPRPVGRLNVGALLRRIELRDWVTLGLLAWMLGAMAYSVQLSRWGDLPSIMPTVFLGLIAGFVITRSKLAWPVKAIAPVVIGFAVVFWQGSIPVGEGDVVNRSIEAWQRMSTWLHDAREGGINRDTVPFALMFMTATWIVGYLTSWITFKWRNPWAPTILLGLGMLTNLSYRQGQFEYIFFVFMLGGVVLFAHLTTVTRIARWEADGTKYPGAIRWTGARNAVVVGVVALLIAALPLVEPRSATLKDTWDLLKAPIELVRDPATRLLAGVRGRGEGMLAAPSKILPFRGPLNLTDEPVMWLKSRYPTLLPARVYDTYTPQGWLTGQHNVFTATANTPLTNPPEELSRERIDQTILPLFPTNSVLNAGTLFSLSRESQLDVLVPRRYTIPLDSPDLDTLFMPPDIGDMAKGLLTSLHEQAAQQQTGGTQDATGDKPEFTEQQVINGLQVATPADVVITLLRDKDSGLPSHVIAERITPPEQTGVRMADEALEQEAYSVVTFVSRATDEELTQTGSAYPRWVTDRYLLLPASLSERVQVLANDVVQSAGAVTPHEKVQAIKEFLQSQSYSLEIPGPDVGEGGVDWFLFESPAEPCPLTSADCDPAEIKGYSHYFGSAASVMLRAVGVPTRMVAGWATGIYVPQARQFVILDNDRHGWTQVYYDNYGWVDVEVTPGRVDPPKDFEVPDLPLGSGDIDDEGLFEIGDEYFAELDDDLLEELGLLQNFPLGSASSDEFSQPSALYIALGVIAGAILLAAAVWTRLHWGLEPERKAYARMVHFGKVIGMGKPPNHTPSEYARYLGFVVPPIAETAVYISGSYERIRYGNQESDPDTTKDLAKAWRRVLRGLLAYRVGLTGRRREGGTVEEMPQSTGSVGVTAAPESS